ncbi:hypothetical protein KP79_PYT17541 [Mizuhopecten yessoensis]|uniref:Alpha-(1,6)-fucosyltransferase n=1 Tax=Mizuhopecten yessoensis TaxID=6573 RepID=A0A210QL86_MIZYE|nr:hypothetical protein KP79_PYT17541 [Mizuhopecten yessoensis]
MDYKTYTMPIFTSSCFIYCLSPHPFLVRALNQQYRTQRSRPRIACAHVRVGGNPNMPGDLRRPEVPLDILWKYFDSLNKEEYDLFIASDSDNVKDLAKKRYPKNIIDTVGKITHIDKPHKNDPREGFLKRILDFYTMVKWVILSIRASGFTMLAAYVRDTDSGLYCWRGQYLRPCSRYIIHNTFPSVILATGTF